MNITEEVIDKFFTGACSVEEKKEIARYFEEHPAEVDKYFPDVEWNDDSKWNEPIDSCVSERMLDEIHYAINKKRLYRKSLYYKVSSIAAVVVLFMGIWYYFEHKPAVESPVAIVPAAKEIIKSNMGTAVEHLILPDSTVVELYPQSTVSYLDNFEPAKRDIHLKGEAVFKVYKDSKRPFTVYSDQISTTALGTRFRVKTGVKEIAVTLYEGKVLVKKADDNLKELSVHNRKYVTKVGNAATTVYKRYYLNAGNEIVYNIRENKFSSIINFLSPENSKPSILIAHAEKSSSSSIVMNNIAMSSALDMLAEKFNVQIEYSPADVADINIIAAINPRQPVDKILKDIASMNNLRIDKTDSQKFIITKITKL
ncbi:hypothetical protein A9P82_05595 [Arachidicoccus ginsenosidimutans]|uniref:FecR family protein n=1 Tax=Arachidicoccus sp. BS20 TaxID=1850526 RepID=UPI0007F0C462|nr:FecR family protein [Arachidicoccus sp. BS20]ANI88807.1 hypothetical protein A9P82_05595 [Arachidicoccus sp. BS20]